MNPEILEACEVRQYKKGDIVLQQEEKADGIYVIKSGTAKVEMKGNIVAHLSEGDFFGEMGTLLHQPRNATIQVTSEELSSYFLSKATFDKLRKEIGEEVIAKMFERIAINCER